MMSINAVKGVEIGEGMAAAALTGARTRTRSSGTGRPVLRLQQGGRHPGRHLDGQDVGGALRVKPTSSILSPRRSIRMDGSPAEVVTKGRHDPCVGIRAVPVGEAMMALVLADHLLLDRGQTGGARGRIG
jgi:chorismate synthase